MIEGKNAGQRHVIPRWRNLHQSQSAGEFDSIRSEVAGIKLSFDPEKARKLLLLDFEREKENWLKTEDPSAAEELLTSAIALDERDDHAVLSAAISVSSAIATAPAMASFAEEIVHGTPRYEPVNPLALTPQLRSEIAFRKHLAALNPRDGLLIAEMALLHLNLGQSRKCKTLLDRALTLLPHHRYVLRAAARFWCHEEEPDKALEILRRSGRTKSDPWLRAAEMATEAIAVGSPSNWRNAKDMLRNERFSPHALSELATQVGTFEIHGGSRRQALKLLRQGAVSPTENSVAQIEFVGRETASFEPDEIVGSSQDSPEATAHKAYWSSEWVAALDACETWHLIEPFSTAPAIFGSFVASVRSTSLDRGLALATSVLNANPHDPHLLNNLAVLYAYSGDTEKATAALRSSRSTNQTELEVTQRATEGLIAFRSGTPDVGILHYETAISTALERHEYTTALRAYCFLGREMTQLSGEWAEVFGAEVDRTITKLQSRGVQIPKDVKIIRSLYSGSSANDVGSFTLTPPMLSEGID